jgi:integrase/recombinase XerD
MTTISPAVPAAFNGDLVLRLAASAYLGRFTGYLANAHRVGPTTVFGWCADHQLRPLEMQRAQVERYVRWMQEVRRRWCPGSTAPA